MISKVICSAALVPMALALGACQTPSAESCKLDYTATGALVGVAVGAAAGSAIAAFSNLGGGAFAGVALAGALVGGIVGAIAGQQQDNACRDFALKQALDKAVELNASLPPEPRPSPSTAAAASAPPRAIPTYQTVGWANQMTGNRGSITPLAPAVDSPKDQICMTFADQVIVNGQPQTVTDRACRGSNGEWKRAAA